MDNQKIGTSHVDASINVFGSSGGRDLPVRIRRDLCDVYYEGFKGWYSSGASEKAIKKAFSDEIDFTLRNKGTILVARSGDETIGFRVLIPFNRIVRHGTSKADEEIRKIYAMTGVQPSRLYYTAEMAVKSGTNGTGNKLYRYGLELAEDKRMEGNLGWTLKNNAPILHLHEKFGAQPIEAKIQGIGVYNRPGGYVVDVDGDVDQSNVVYYIKLLRR